MNEIIKVIPAIFFRTAAGNAPVREWLQGLDKDDRIAIGQDIKTVEFGWPIGMPTCRLTIGLPLGGFFVETCAQSLSAHDVKVIP